MSLKDIRARVENAPRLAVSKAYEGGYAHHASVYEEEDGLNTLCNIPHVYNPEWQDRLAEEIVAAYEDRAKLLSALDAVCKSVTGLAESLAEDEMEAGARSVAERAIKDWKRPEY